MHCGKTWGLVLVMLVNHAPLSTFKSYTRSYKDTIYVHENKAPVYQKLSYYFAVSDLVEISGLSKFVQKHAIC